MLPRIASHRHSVCPPSGGSSLPICSPSLPCIVRSISPRLLCPALTCNAVPFCCLLAWNWSRAPARLSWRDEAGVPCSASWSNQRAGRNSSMSMYSMFHAFSTISPLFHAFSTVLVEWSQILEELPFFKSF